MIKNYVTHIQMHEKSCITKGCVPTLDVANISKPITYISCYSCQLSGKKLWCSVSKNASEISLHVSTFNSIFVKVPEYNSEPYVYTSHRNGMKSVTISTTVYQVGVFQLRSPSQKILWHLFLETPRGPPSRAFNFMHAWRCRYMTETITIQFISSKRILMPYLKVNFWPTCKFIILHANIKSMEIKQNLFWFSCKILVSQKGDTLSSLFNKRTCL